MDKNISERHVSIKTVNGSLIQGKMNIGSMTGENKVFIINKSNIAWVEPGVNGYGEES